MLTEKEKMHCMSILELISDEDIMSLAQTSTNRSVDVTDRSEAEKAILAYTETLQEFFKRRKISKEILLKYLYQNGYPITRNAEKDKIASDIIGYWQTDIKPHQPPKIQQEQKPVYNYSPTSITINLNMNYSTSPESSSASLRSDEQSSAQAFVSWFYDMLNSCNPFLNKPPQDFGPHHFWSNAQLFLIMNTASSKVEDQIEGNVQVSQRLLQFPQQQSLIFSPNLSAEGVQVKTDPHGLKLILVCGTLHLTNNCIGVFQQSFGLVRDPVVPDHWKIKIMCLKMDEQQALTIPTLNECEGVAAIEGHTVRVLQQSLADT